MKNKEGRWGKTNKRGVVDMVNRDRHAIQTP